MVRGFELDRAQAHEHPPCDDLPTQGVGAGEHDQELALRRAPHAVEATQLAAQRELHVCEHLLDELIAVRSPQRGQILDVEQKAAERGVVAGGAVGLLLQTLAQSIVREVSIDPRGGRSVSSISLATMPYAGGERNHVVVNERKFTCRSREGICRCATDPSVPADTPACVLQDLRVENLLLIEQAELELAPGLNVLTGETGAGKTVLAHALDLLLGGRARAGIVRPGASEAYVEGAFAPPRAAG